MIISFSKQVCPVFRTEISSVYSLKVIRECFQNCHIFFLFYWFFLFYAIISHISWPRLSDHNSKWKLEVQWNVSSGSVQFSSDLFLEGRDLRIFIHYFPLICRYDEQDKKRQRRKDSNNPTFCKCLVSNYSISGIYLPIILHSNYINILLSKH